MPRKVKQHLSKIFIIGLFAGWGGFIVNSENATPEAKNIASWILLMVIGKFLFGDGAIKLFEKLNDFIKLKS